MNHVIGVHSSIGLGKFRTLSPLTFMNGWFYHHYRGPRAPKEYQNGKGMAAFVAQRLKNR